MDKTGPQASGHEIGNSALTVDALERLYRQQALANAIATVRLEGIEVDATTLADMERFVRGEMTIADVLQHLRQRVAAGEFRDPPETTSGVS
jgi:Antitoxin VbhA